MMTVRQIILRQSFTAMARSAAAAVLAGAVSLVQTSIAAAQSNVPIVRDAEIEALVTDYAAPIINTGALLQAETPNEIIGVLAHETGHLAEACPMDHRTGFAPRTSSMPSANEHA